MKYVAVRNTKELALDFDYRAKADPLETYLVNRSRTLGAALARI